MSEHPLHPAAEQVLGMVPAWSPAELVAALADQVAGVTTGLAARFASWADSPAAPVDTGVLLAAADREADHLGSYYIRCEHLLLGMQRVLGAGDAEAGASLAAARADFHWLKCEQAFGEYLKLRPAPRPDGASRPCAVVLGGVPGTGKSTLAEALGRELRAPVFSADWELGALVPFGALRQDNLEPLSELVLAAALARQLQLGMDAILDGALLRAEERRRLREIAERLGAAFVGVECLCSDREVQRSRVQGRVRGIPGWPATVSWEHVQRMRERWEPWTEPHLVVDSAVQRPALIVRQVMDAINAGR